MAVSQAAFLVADRLAGFDRLADRDERPVGGQREGWWPEAVQLAQQIARGRRGAVPGRAGAGIART